MSLSHLNITLSEIHEGAALQPLPAAIRTGDIPVSVQALIALQCMEQTTTLLWIASDNREMQQLHETLLTLKIAEQVYPFFQKVKIPLLSGSTSNFSHALQR